MNILLNTLGDPIWQVLALVIALAAPMLMVVVRTREVHTSEQQKRRDTLTMLWVWLATFLLMSGVLVALHLPDAAPQRTSSTAPSPIPTMALPPSPTSTPTSIPTPTPTPRLAYSIYAGPDDVLRCHHYPRLPDGLEPVRACPCNTRIRNRRRSLPGGR
jgi:hypothetical protein